MTNWRVLITCPPLVADIETHRQEFAEHHIDIEVVDVVQQLTEEQLKALLPDMDGIIVGDDPLTGDVLRDAPRLKVISKWGVGVDNIDLAAAEELGMRVTNTPRAFGAEVADVVLGYLILLARQLHRVDAGVRSGQWPKPQGSSLAGRTLGIIGLGDIGRALAVRASAAGMRVAGTDVSRDAEEAAVRSGVLRVPFDELLRTADVVSLNCPLTSENRHMLGAEAFGSMKRGVWIVNTARGQLIDEAALIAALERGQVAAAALDVFEVEPLPMASPLRDFPQVILGSHNSSNTEEAVSRTTKAAIANLVAGLQAGLVG